MKSQSLNDILKKALSINRKLHIHFGLFIILFIWLFFVSGLIIHHGEWKFAKFYENRIESKKEFIIIRVYTNILKYTTSSTGKFVQIKFESIFAYSKC